MTQEATNRFSPLTATGQPDMSRADGLGQAISSAPAGL